MKLLIYIMVSESVAEKCSKDSDCQTTGTFCSLGKCLCGLGYNRDENGRCRVPPETPVEENIDTSGKRCFTIKNFTTG